jgi:hypothetical protein
MLAGCSASPLGEEEELKSYCSAVFKERDGKAEMSIAERLLGETEEALNITEFKDIWGLYGVLEHFDTVVCLKGMDDTVYYSLIKRIDDRREVVRIRKDSVIDGEIVWYNSNIHQTMLTHQP